MERGKPRLKEGGSIAWSTLMSGSEIILGHFLARAISSSVNKRLFIDDVIFPDAFESIAQFFSSSAGVFGHSNDLHDKTHGRSDPKLMRTR
jgi:hypothetical protein